ncbi:MAG: chromate transporter [Acidobacteria bacterium]|nr:MAG: chromate transporter [Acidobacteriota bacterium]
MPSIARLAAYFFRLGALGFGGPVALANAMRRDLVEERAWLTAEEYEDGLALAAACPGPLAYQLAVYCGYIRRGVAGGLAVAVAFALAPFLLVLAVAALYQRFAATWQLRALFYGIAPAVVALIVRACWNLGRKTLRTDVRAWLFFTIACAVTVVVEREIAWMFIIAGLLGALVFGERAAEGAGAPLSAGAPLRAIIFPLYGGTTSKLFLFFFKTGLLVFGSGLVIVPFLKAQVVDEYHWLTNHQFLDAVAIGMISPGPVVITATFVGYILDGVAGALAATLGIFTPPVLFVLCATPILLRYRNNARLRGFVRGVGTAVVGVLVGTTWLIARVAIGDALTIAVALLSVAALARWRKLPEPVVIAAAAIVGLIAYPG